MKLYIEKGYGDPECGYMYFLFDENGNELNRHISSNDDWAKLDLLKDHQEWRNADIEFIDGENTRVGGFIMTFTVIDKETGHKVSADVRREIAKNGGLMEMDIDQFAVCEDGSIILLDDCGNIAYCVQNAFEIRIDSIED